MNGRAPLVKKVSSNSGGSFSGDIWDAATAERLFSIVYRSKGIVTHVNLANGCKVGYWRRTGGPHLSSARGTFKYLLVPLKTFWNFGANSKKKSESTVEVTKDQGSTVWPNFAWQLEISAKIHSAEGFPPKPNSYEKRLWSVLVTVVRISIDSILLADSFGFAITDSCQRWRSPFKKTL